MLYVPHETTALWQPSAIASLTIGSAYFWAALCLWVPLDDSEDDVTRGSGLTQWGPLAAGLSIYLGLTGLLLFLGMHQAAGTFVYAQDDPYIHLTVARTLAEHGVWGIRPDQFASASSSPLWTVLLAILWKLGAHAVWWPLVVNVVCGIAVLALVDAIVRDSIAPSKRAMLLIAVVVITPLPTLALVGMEHTLQVLLSVALAWQIVLVLDTGADNAGIGTACLLAAVLTATRYEGLFIVTAGAAMLAVRRRFGQAAALSVAAALPVVAFAVYSVAHDALLLPNSILMKSQPERFGTLGEGVAAVLADWATIFSLFSRPQELALTLSILLVLARIPGLRVPALRRPALLGSLFTIAMLLHACLVKLEWFYRYEAALIAMGVLALAWIVAQETAREALIAPLLKSSAGGALVALLLLPLATRSLSALAVTPGAMRNVYEQQYQMARFFSERLPA